MNATNDLKEVCDVLRAEIDAVADRLKGLRQHSALMHVPVEPRGEMFSNITLAYRHLEDARMRIGKVIQHFESGVSKYDAPRAHQPSTINPQPD
jgi:hypothetical protein